jgi:hypothetical protein
MKNLICAWIIGAALLVSAADLPAEDDDTRPASSIIRNSIVQYPLTYRAEPIGFREYPPGYQEVPRNKMEKPYGYREVPLNYTEKILTDIGLPRGYNSNPPNFIIREAHPGVNNDPDKQLSISTNPQANNDPSLKISIENNPVTSKIVKSSDQPNQQ